MTDITDRLSRALADRYEIERELGAGGMATVHLARDLRHNRHVAIKVLRPELAAVIGAERFLKEIEVTANLQHPHVLPLYDSGEADTLLYYVMPFVEGESLRDRLRREKQLPVGEAVRLTTEVADALQYAHDRGVVHRDVKPENVLLQNGRALVADFGIALAVQQAGGSRLTETGLSLGTPHYMSPEQAMGERDLDARSDIYALAAMLYEMLAGEPPFTGPNTQAIVAKVLTAQPEPVHTLRRTVSPEVARAVHIGLEKLPADRFATAADFGRALSVGTTRTGGSIAPAGPRWSKDPRTAALAVVALAALILGGWSLMSSDAPLPRTRRAMIPVDNALDMRGTDLAISRDGRTLVVSGGFGVSGLTLRRLDQVEVQAIPRSDGGEFPFLSPNGSQLGFSTTEGVVVQGIDGSNRQILPPSLGGGTFLDEERIVVVDPTGLVLTNLTTGERELLLPHDTGIPLHAPHAMDGGARITFTVFRQGVGAAAQARALDIRTGVVDTLLDGALSAQQIGDWLYYALPGGGVQAAPMTPTDRRPTGPGIALGDVAMINREGSAILATGDGVIVYGVRQLNHLVALTPDGRRSVLTQTPALYHSPRVSPDGQRLVFDIDEGGSGDRDVWTMDLIAGGQPTRVTSVGDAHDPVWTPDGRGVTYVTFQRPEAQLFTVSADGAPGERMLATPEEVLIVNPGTWLPAGNRYVAGLVSTTQTGTLVILSENTPPDTIIGSSFDEHSPAISPDGQWLAYVSTETGQTQVYVRRFDGAGGRTLVSEIDGTEPVWGPRGAELFFTERVEPRARLLAAQIAPGDPPRVVGRRVVFDNLAHEPVGNHTNWDLTPNGRFIMVEPQRGGRLTLIFNWTPPVN